MSLVFLFGAGASAFSGDCYPKEPPLGSKLFDELVKGNGVAATLPSGIADKFRDPTRYFEAGMEALHALNSPLSIRFVIEMAMYFAQFKPGADNLYVRLLQRLGKRIPHIVFATLNYEMLLEYGAASVGYPMITNQCRSKRHDSICLLKLHGSCHFLIDRSAVSVINSTFTVGAGQAASGPIVPASSGDEVIRYYQSGQSLPPAMSMYARGKQVMTSRDYVNRQVDEWRERVKTAHHVFIIGVSVNREDLHIWDVLRDSAATLHYVDPSPRAFQEWVCSTGRANAKHLAGTFRQAIDPILRIVDAEPIL